MFAKIGLLLAAFIGVKIYDSYLNKHGGLKKELKPSVKSRKSLARMTNIEESEKFCDHYFKAGTVYLGIAVLTG